MRTLALAVVLAMSLVVGLPPAAADSETAERAYLEGNYGRALRLLKPHLKAGDPDAQYLMGVMRAHGEGVRRNYKKAAEWYQKAAEQSHHAAQFNLGFMYLYGAGEGKNGVEPNPVLAAAWLLGAAQGDIPAAQALVGRMYRTGTGLKKSLEHAREWTLKAAEQGNSGARFTAGLMLAYGEGGDPDLVEAYKWFLLAAESHFPGAAQNLERLERELTADEIKEAKLRAGQ